MFPLIGFGSFVIKAFIIVSTMEELVLLFNIISVACR